MMKFKVGDRFEHPHGWQGVVLGIQDRYSPYSARMQKSFLVLDDDGHQRMLSNMNHMDGYLKHLGKHDGAPLPHVSHCPLCNMLYAWYEQDPKECRVCAKLPQVGA